MHKQLCYHLQADSNQQDAGGTASDAPDQQMPSTPHGAASEQTDAPTQGSDAPQTVASAQSHTGTAQPLHWAAAAAWTLDNKLLRRAVTAGFQQVDNHILAKCKQSSWTDGCTCVAVWVVHETVLVANIGKASCLSDATGQVHLVADALLLLQFCICGCLSNPAPPQPAADTAFSVHQPSRWTIGSISPHTGP